MLENMKIGQSKVIASEKSFKHKGWHVEVNELGHGKWFGELWTPNGKKHDSYGPYKTPEQAEKNAISTVDELEVGASLIVANAPKVKKGDKIKFWLDNKEQEAKVVGPMEPIKNFYKGEFTDSFQVPVEIGHHQYKAAWNTDDKRWEFNP
jgi:hypothetical protein